MVFRGQTLGKYRIIEPLGSGGFGTVYLAEDTWIDKRVAIKVPHRQSLDFGELLREPRLLASLNHPNIVTVITAEKQDNVFFIVMEYVPGETLETIIANKGALDLPQALDYTCQILNAVEHAHAQGVIHRDLRPANVFVTDTGLLKVGDFGTSRFLEIAAHGTTVIGSPPYMAPEQFEGRAVFASDLYSLGITMYQMLTGRAALRHAGAGGSRAAAPRRAGQAAAPQESDDSAGDREIVMRALAGDVASRYQRAEDLLSDLLRARREIARKPVAVDAAASPHARHARGSGGQALSSPDARAAPSFGEPAPPAHAARRPSPARLRTREISAGRFCWNCRKPLPARGSRCPFCGESQ